MAVRTAVAMGAILCGTVPNIPAAPAATADDLAIEPRIVRPGQRLTVVGNCADADNLVQVSGAARGTGAVRDGWFEVKALVLESEPGRHVLEAKCVESQKARAGRFEVRKQAKDPGPDGGGEGEGFGPDDGEFGHERDNGFGDEHGENGKHGEHKGGEHKGGGVFGAEKQIIGFGEKEKEKGHGGGGVFGGEKGVIGGGGGIGPGGGGGGFGPGGEKGGAPKPRGYAETGGGGTQVPEAPWLPTGVVLLAAAAGIGGTALMRSRARGRA